MESLKERKQEKKKVKTTEATASKESSSVLSRNEEIQAPLEESTKIVEEDFFPPFREYAHMYFMPRNRELFESWLSEWSTFLLSWAAHHKKLVVSIDDIRKSPAFSYNEYTLSINSITTIFEHMVKQKYAKWLSDKKDRIRIFWLSDEALAEEIYKWAWKTGNSLLDVYKLLDSEQYWSSLPPEYLEHLLDLLVKSGKARWISKEKRIVEIKLHGFR